MKAVEQYFPVVPFVMLYKVILPFESVDKILRCHHSIKVYDKNVLVILLIALCKRVVVFPY